MFKNDVEFLGIFYGVYYLGDALFPHPQVPDESMVDAVSDLKTWLGLPCSTSRIRP